MEKEEDQGVYVISIAARLANVHPQTLRMYERKGLLSPARTLKNRRCYSEADIARLSRIQELTQSCGLNLSGVAMVLEMEEEILGLKEKVDRLELELTESRQQVMEEMRNLKRQVAISTKPPSGLVFKKHP